MKYVLLKFFAMALLIMVTVYAQEDVDSLLVSICQNEEKLASLRVRFTVKLSLSKDRENTGEFIWYLKGNKMRLDEIDSLTKKQKSRGIYDGEKYIVFFYFEDIPEGGMGPASSKFKRGDITQVQINKINMPTLDEAVGRMDLPLAYLGIGIDYGMAQGSKLLSEALKGARTKLMGKENIEGATCYVLEIYNEGEVPVLGGGKEVFQDRKKIWIDPAIGYKIRQRIDYFPNNNRERFLLKCKDFKQSGDVWIPHKVEATYLRYDEQRKKSSTFATLILELSECEVNGEIPDTIFSLELPKGTAVWDIRSDRFYKWGEKQPTDEDILKIAEVAKGFLEGNVSLNQIIEEYKDKGKSESYNCGPNALLAVCGILGVETTSKKIAELSGTDEKGFTSMAGLKRAAEALGLKAEGMDLTLDELKRENKLAIAWLPPGHYIVVVGFADDKVVIIDPPTALTVIPIYGLDNLWDGRVLLVSKR